MASPTASNGKKMPILPKEWREEAQDKAEARIEREAIQAESAEAEPNGQWGPTMHNRTSPTVRITPVSDPKFKVERRTFLVDQLIQENNLCLFAGPPGMGKSKAVCKLISAVTTGERFAGRETLQGDVLLYSAEDNFRQDTLPCLENEGFDGGKLHLLEGDLSLRIISDFLQDNPTVRMVVLDPAIDTALHGRVNGNSAIDIRKALQPVQALCTQHNVTCVGLVHFRKADGSGLDGATALDRIAGSGAWAQVARSIIVFANSKDHPPEDGVRLMIPAKAQQAAIKGGWQYRIECDPESPWPDTATVHLEADPVSGTPEQLLAGTPRITQKAQCIEDLIGILDEAKGWVPRNQLTKRLADEYSVGTINAAFTSVNAMQDKSHPDSVIKGTRERRGRYCLNHHIAGPSVDIC